MSFRLSFRVVIFLSMAKEIFEEAQEVFIDDRYDEAYEVRIN